MRMQCGRVTMKLTKKWKMLLLVFLAVMSFHFACTINAVKFQRFFFFTIDTSLHKNLSSAHLWPSSEIISNLQQQAFVCLPPAPRLWTQSPLYYIIYD